MLKDRVEAFREEFGISVTGFCRRAGISPTTYYNIVKGSVLSDATVERIDTYLIKYGF